MPPITATTNRYAIIDWLRTLAIVLMLIYHFIYDLVMFRLIDSSVFLSLPMTVLGRSCLCLFLFCVGYSLAISHSRGLRWRSYAVRLAKITVAASLVSLATWIAYPAHWIYFGILHCIAVASVLALLFLPFPTIAGLLGLALMSAYWFFDQTLPWFHAGRPSLDYIALFPWFGMVLIGIAGHRWRIHEHLRVKPQRWVQWLSRHSLAIYLVHQPLLIGLAFLLTLNPLQ
jgi:uncharacterized membrane protein